MRVVILQDDFPPNSFGGAGVVALNAAQELQKRGHDVLVITTVRKGNGGETSYQGVRVRTIVSHYPLRFQAYVSLWNTPVVRKVERILQEFKPDVVHAHNVHGYLSWWSLVVAKKLGARVILTCHDVISFNYTKLVDFIDPKDLSVPREFNYRVSAWRQLLSSRFRYNPFRNIVIRYILRKYVDTILPVSSALSDALKDNGIKATAVVHNGIDADSWKESSESVSGFKQKHGLGDSVILFGGRLTAVKGGEKLLEALSIVRKEVPDIQLLVVGKKDAYAERLLAKAADSGLKGKVIFTDWITGSELHQAYYASALVAVPSLCFDSFPTMNLEAFACAKPVVATCFGGSREIIDDGISGYIVNPYDVETMAQKITKILSDAAMRSRFGEAGHARAVRDFTLTKQAELFEHHYKN
ncbi:glycosyltransferase family 4 protein [Candidatus Kaiserbacteria bacterium]|nr:glycosyltransferase family 4 protein [Candidatus Kaiserbacteria bacterium]